MLSGMTLLLHPPGPSLRQNTATMQSPAPAPPQNDSATPAAEPRTQADDDIVVIAPGANRVAGELPPDTVLDETAIASYGASSLTDLVAALSAQTGSGRGRGSGPPVVLVNGRRVSGFGEIRNLPPEAVQRVEIFPEETALEYGFGADQRVINFVLKDRFAAITTEVEGGAATAGGRRTGEAEASLLRLAGKSRLNVTLGYEGAARLTEAQRAIVQPSAPITAAPGAALDSGRFRTLLPATDQFSFDATYALPLSGSVAASANARLERTDSRTLIGLAPATVSSPVASGTQLRARTRGDTAHTGGTVDGRLGRWRWTVTGNYDHGFSRTTSDRAVDPLATAPTPRLAGDTTRTRTDTADADGLLAGPLFALPAGDVRTTVQGGWRSITLAGRSDRSGIVTFTDLARTALSASTTIDVPIASRRNAVLPLLGDLAFNGRVALRDVSDFTTLISTTAGVSWSPLERLDLIASWINDESAPSVSQLGAPLLTTPLRPVFDFTRGETVLANVTTGGNPALRAESRRDFKLSGTWRPIAETDFSLTSTYARTRSRDTTAELPPLTAAIETAFPGRIVRGADGRIVAVDARPVNFTGTRGRQLRSGISFARTFGAPALSALPRGPVARPAGGGGGGGGGGRGGGGGGMGGFGGPNAAGRWSIAAYHTIRFEDRVILAPGLPVLDLLRGGALGTSGGSARHTLEFDGGWFNRGIGIRGNGTYAAATRVDGGGTGGGGTGGGASSSTGDLRFGSLFTVNLRIFADLSQQAALVRRAPWLRGTRVRLSIDNLLGSVRDVRDANGAVPLQYQRGYLDPTGRAFEISLRKQF